MGGDVKPCSIKNMKTVKAPCDCQLHSLDSFETLTLFSNACLLRELLPPLSYLFIVLLADRRPTNGRAYATVLRPLSSSFVVVVCDVIMYCR